MPKKLTLLEKGAKKEIARIQFKPLVTIAGGYKLLGNSPFARDPSVYGTTTTLTTGDGFYLVFHYPIKKVGKRLFVLTPNGGLEDIMDGGINDAINFTFSDKNNLKALKVVRKAHLKFKREYPSGANVLTIMTYTTAKPVALTVGVTKGKRRGLELPPDIIYTIKDRDAIEEAGIVIGKGTREIFNEISKSLPRFARDVVSTHKNLQTVYKLSLANYKLVGNTVISDATDKEWARRVIRLLRAFKDPMLEELASNFLIAFPSIAEKNGYSVPPDLRLYFAFNIPIGSRKGGFDVRVLSGGREFDLQIPNPNPRGRKKFIRAKSLLFYGVANEFIRHKHSNTKKSPKVDVLSFEHLIR